MRIPAPSVVVARLKKAPSKDDRWPSVVMLLDLLRCLALPALCSSCELTAASLKLAAREARELLALGKSQLLRLEPRASSNAKKSASTLMLRCIVTDFASVC